MNPTCNVLESRYAQLEGGHPLSGLSVSSGMTGESVFSSLGVIVIIYSLSIDVVYSFAVFTN